MKSSLLRFCQIFERKPLPICVLLANFRTIENIGSSRSEHRFAISARPIGQPAICPGNSPIRCALAFLAANNVLWGLASRVMENRSPAMAARHWGEPSPFKYRERWVHGRGGARTICTDIARHRVWTVRPGKIIRHRDPVNGLAILHQPRTPATLHTLLIEPTAKLRNFWRMRRRSTAASVF